MPTPAHRPVRRNVPAFLRRGLIATLVRYLPTQQLLALPSRATVYSPAVVVWASVVQALDGQHSDRAASYRVGHWLDLPVNVRSGALCKARGRLEVDLYRDLVGEVATTIKAVGRKVLKGRRLRTLDATSLTVADTPENRAAFGLPAGVQPGWGYPVLRMAVLMDSRTGAVLAWAIGDGDASEAVLAQPLLEFLEPGDVLIADSYYGIYGLVAQLRSRGIDLIARQHHARQNCPPGRRRDWDEVWARPDPLHPLYRPFCDAPDQVVRCLWVERPERTTLKLITTLSPEQASAKTIRRCYRDRWRIETQLNQLKTVQGADFLPARSPDSVARAVGAQLLALNLLCAWRCDVAREQRCDPWRLSLAGLLDGLLATVGDRRPVADQRAWLLACARGEKVPERPGRSEPRKVKRRPKPFTYLTQPRDKARASLVGRR